MGPAADPSTATAPADAPPAATPPPASPPPATPDADRGLKFEAKKFALDTLVKIYLERSDGSRALVVSHARFMLTLAIAAMAGFVTVFAAMLRASPHTDGWMQPVPAALALCGLGLLVASALWATRTLSRAAAAATKLLRDPFPAAEAELTTLFGAPDEDVVIDSLIATIRLHIAETVPGNDFGGYATASLVAGTVLAAASIVYPFVATAP